MLKAQIEKDFQKFLKEKKEREISVLRMLKAAIFNLEKEKRYNLAKERKIPLAELKKESQLAKELEKESSLSDEEVIEVLLREIKKRKEAISEFEKGKREDLVKKEKAEIEILKRYLPKVKKEEK
jgi:uncharacterized protein YqeY